MKNPFETDDILAMALAFIVIAAAWYFLSLDPVERRKPFVRVLPAHAKGE